MKNYIKKLVEQLFDDNYDDIIGDDINKPDISELYDKIDVLKYIDKIEDPNYRLSNFKEVLSKYNKWSDMIAESDIKPIEVRQLDLSLYYKTIEPLIKVFDELLEHDVKIRFGLLILLLDDSNTVHCISDIIDFEKYKSIFTIDCFAVTHGHLDNLKGLPSYITEELTFDWIKGLKNFEGFPDNEYDLLIDFEFTPLPETWQYFPNHMQNLILRIPSLYNMSYTKKYHYSDEDYENDVKEINQYYGKFIGFPKDIKYGVTHHKDYLRYVGFLLIEDNWPTRIKKYARSYVSACLKVLHLPVAQLKYELCHGLYILSQRLEDKNIKKYGEL